MLDVCLSVTSSASFTWQTLKFRISSRAALSFVSSFHASAPEGFGRQRSKVKFKGILQIVAAQCDKVMCHRWKLTLCIVTWTYPTSYHMCHLLVPPSFMLWSAPLSTFVNTTAKLSSA